MEILVFLALALWIWLQSQRIGALTRRLETLEARLAAPPPTAAAPTVASDDPLLLDTPLAPDELLLDTPLPEASNDVQLPQAEAPARTPAQDDADERVPFPPKAARPPPRVTQVRRWERWLAENGFAWLGGGALALGGVFLVSIAAQQGWFTPAVRLAAALAFGAALVIGSEWVRRAGLRRSPGQPLVAAMLAGAGMVTLYATVWAAHALYGVVGPLQAGVLLALCAAVLAALALHHGQALGVMAIALALLAPPFASIGLWPTFGVTLYVCAIGIAGFVLAAWRRWAWLAAATLLGLYFWFAASIMMGDIGRALALASLAALGAVAAAFRKPQTEEAKAMLGWSRIGADLPAIAIAVTSVLLLWTWVSVAESRDDSVGRLAWVSGMIVLLAAGAVRARVSAPASFAVAAGGLALGFIFYAGVRYLPPGGDFYPFILSSAAIAAFAALFANPHRAGRRTVAAAGAIASAILAALGAATRDEWHSAAAWLSLFATAALLLFCATRAAAQSNEPTRDQTVVWWVGASTALILLGVESAFTEAMRSAAHAGVALSFAAAFSWRKWTALRFASLAGATFALAHALSPSLLRTALAGGAQVWTTLAILALAAVLLLGAARLMRRADSHRYASESLSAGAVIITLAAAFIALRWFAAGAAGATIDSFTEASLRALTLTAAGYVLAPRDTAGMGVIGRWRGHALLGVGLLHAVLGLGFAEHPWWGFAPVTIPGAPIFNALLLAFAANGAAALSAARKLHAHHPISARVLFSTGAVLLLVWAVSETRHAFHGAAMATQTAGPLETAIYALLCLSAALVLALFAQRVHTPFRDAAARVATWGALAVAVLLLLVARPPWLSGVAPSDGLAMARVLVVHVGATVLAWRLAVALTRNSAVDYTRFTAAAAAMVFAWSAGHGVIRWLHGGSGDLVGLEGFAHALWPFAFVLGAHALGARARTAEPASLHDVRAILAVAAWPTLLLAVLGLAFLYYPWWGVAPARVADAGEAALAVAAFAAGAWMSAAASAITPVVFPSAFARARFLAGVAHVFAAITFVVRWAFHGPDLAHAPISGVEMWSYSAAWALLGASLFALGSRRADAWLRWLGLALLLITTAKVFLIDMGELSGLVRVGSFVGLGAVLLTIAWFARRSSAPRP